MYTLSKLGPSWIIEDPDDPDDRVFSLLSETTEADARRIAHALNHHDALVGALKDTTENLEWLEGVSGGSPWLGVIEHARAVLAAAKGGAE